MQLGKKPLLALLAVVALLVTASVPALFAATTARIDRSVPAAETTPGISDDGALPPVAVVEAQQWLAQHLGLSDTAHVNLVSAEQRQWPDVCLGLGEEDEVCAQLPSDGWEVKFDVDGQRYTLRTDWVGAEVRLAGQMAVPGDSASPLAGTSWQLVSLNGTPVISGTVVTLAFGADGSATGQGGCNSYGGAYTTEGSTLTFNNIVSTLRACADNAITAQEQAYLGVVNLQTTYALSGNQLTITNSGDTAVFTRNGGTPGGQTPTLPSGWMRQSFGAAWDVAHPSGWTMNADGSHEGYVELTGDYQGHTYKVALSYPIGIMADNVGDWTADSLAQLTPVHADLAVHALMVAGAEARFARSVPLGYEPSPQHRVYVWSAGGLNPRLITFTQVDDQDYDAQAMADFALLFLAQVRGAAVLSTPTATPTTVPMTTTTTATTTTGLSAAPAGAAAAPDEGQAAEGTEAGLTTGCDAEAEVEVNVGAEAGNQLAAEVTTNTEAAATCAVENR